MLCAIVRKRLGQGAPRRKRRLARRLLEWDRVRSRQLATGEGAHRHVAIQSTARYCRWKLKPIILQGEDRYLRRCC